MEKVVSYLFMLQIIIKTCKKPHWLNLVKILKSLRKKKKERCIKKSLKVLSVDYNTIYINGALDIHIYLMKTTLFKILLGFIKKWLWHC